MNSRKTKMLSNQMIRSSTAPTQFDWHKITWSQRQTTWSWNKCFVSHIGAAGGCDSAHPSCDHNFPHCEYTPMFTAFVNPHRRHLAAKYFAVDTTTSSENHQKSLRMRWDSVRQFTFCRTMAYLRRLCSQGEIMIFIFDDDYIQPPPVARRVFKSSRESARSSP